MNVRRAASIGSALIVAGIAALASYTHMRGLALRYGQTEAIADLLPISVDGMMVVATIALGDGRRYRWSAWLAFWIGVNASVVANVLAAQPSTIARCISAWPAIAFLLVVEVITRRGRVAESFAGVLPDPAPADVTAEIDPWDYAEPVEPASVPDTPPAPKRTATRTPRRTAQADTTAAKIARLRTQRPDITQKQVADKVGVDVRTVRRYWPDTAPDSPPDSEAATKPVNGHAVDLITTN